MSLALLPRRKKWAKYEEMCRKFDEGVDDRDVYFAASVRTSEMMSQVVEDDLELLSDVATWGERYRHHWPSVAGVYECARCSNPIYAASSKWNGPCVWPSFRSAVSESSLDYQDVSSYNGYTCRVDELYCRRCSLFIGHRFEDGREKGDVHPEAHWRH
jgi:peptide-methionine (R)-S-oxide reductase